MDQTNRTRPKRAIKRFKKVYQRFDKVAIGSNKMKEIFKDAFGLQDDRFLTTGIPRTDFFFNDEEKKSAKIIVQNKLSLPKDKKVLLYAPTYRDGEFNDIKIHLDFKAMYKNFKDDYILLLRLHPAIKYNKKSNYPNFVYDVSNYDYQ